MKTVLVKRKKLKLKMSEGRGLIDKKK